jgi:hypothetical protein
VPEVGITGTPVVDLSSGTLYVDAFTHDGPGIYHHNLHALNITNGTERSSSPVVVSASIAGTGVGSSSGVISFEARQHLQRCALSLSGGRVYLPYAGYADTDPYHGWIIGFDSASLQQLPEYVFNTTPNSTVAAFGPHAGEGGIWMAGGGLSVDQNGDLLFAVGNGSFNALNNSGGTEYGDSFMRLSTLQGLAVADYFTPYNQAFLADNDLDIGSGGLLLLPDQTGPFAHLMLGGGKAGKLYLINRDMMTQGNNHYNSGGSVDFVVQTLSLGGGVFATPAYFNEHIYCAASGDVLAGLTMIDGMLSSDISTTTRRFTYPGATPSISGNGTSNGIVWALQTGSPGVLAAYDANSLSNEIYNSTQLAGRDSLTNGIKFAVPTIANGKVYAAGQYRLSVFSLLGTPLAIWRSAHFGANANNSAIAGDLADPDGDGLPNIWEYALASDPNQPDADRRPSGVILGNQFQLRFSRNLTATDLTFMVQKSSSVTGPWTDLLTYTTAAGWVANGSDDTVSETSVMGSAPDESVAVTITENTQTSPSTAAFFRVQVTE